MATRRHALIKRGPSWRAQSTSGGPIGDGLRSRTDERRATEVAVATHALNRMLELGRPNYVRIA